mmetsp:Transcript_33172/g.109653  ORF Transcript_33172/g.109653 Transcript_33172/m.109653 type:complete len:239 (+) Transcript_33172:431-1147(+)
MPGADASMAAERTTEKATPALRSAARADASPRRLRKPNSFSCSSSPATSYPSAADPDASTNGVGVPSPAAGPPAPPPVRAAMRARRPISSATVAAASATPSSSIAPSKALTDDARARRASSSSSRPPSPRPLCPRPKPGSRSSNRSAPNRPIELAASASLPGSRRRVSGSNSDAHQTRATAPRSAARKSGSWRSSHGTSSSRSSPYPLCTVSSNCDCVSNEKPPPSSSGARAHAGRSA